jgi:membrane protease subunit (stomatin/prohibitin family)
LLRRIIGAPFGGRTPFQVEVWYINKLHNLDVKWGTPSPIQLQDPLHKIFVPVRANGQFGMRVVGSKNFLNKLVGTNSQMEKEAIAKQIRGLYVNKVKTALGNYIGRKNISVLQVNLYLEEMSRSLRDELSLDLHEYGIEILNFYVNDINIPDDNPSIVELKAALARQAALNVHNVSYSQARTLDVLEGAATNPGGNAAMIMGMGLGQNLAGVAGGLMHGVSVEPKRNCFHCSAEVDNSSKFCSRCGKDISLPTTETTPCSNCSYAYPKTYKFCPECGDIYNPCGKCGADIRKDMTTCPVCGEGTLRKCLGCTHVLNGTELFCPKCGAPQSGGGK